jgi:hypothetical protein
MKRAPGEVAISLQYARHLGPRYAQAGISLRFEGGPAFSFSSIAEWPDEDCTAAVREGVESALIEHLGALPNVRVVLERVEWHEVDSSMNAFKQAARGAVLASLTV